jgi:hypothetical protein
LDRFFCCDCSKASLMLQDPLSSTPKIAAAAAELLDESLSRQ